LLFHFEVGRVGGVLAAKVNTRGTRWWEVAMVSCASGSGGGRCGDGSQYRFVEGGWAGSGGGCGGRGDGGIRSSATRRDRWLSEGTVWWTGEERLGDRARGGVAASRCRTRTGTKRESRTTSQLDGSPASTGLITPPQCRHPEGSVAATESSSGGNDAKCRQDGA